jgi:hypothetical protein
MNQERDTNFTEPGVNHELKSLGNITLLRLYVI